MRSLDLTVELRHSGFDVDMPNAQVLYVPMKLRLELMAAISPDLLDTERELVDDVIGEGDGVLLRMSAVDLRRAYAGRIVNGGVLIALNLLASLISENQELNIHLNMVTWHFLVIPFGVDLSTSHLAR